MTLAAVLILAAGAACKRQPRITTPEATVVGIPDAGTPATLATSETVAEIPLAPGSVVERVEVPATPTTPAQVTTRVVPSAPTAWRETHKATSAGTGTVDQQVALRRADNEARKPFLFAAIAAAALAVGALLKGWPTPSAGCAVAAVAFFLFWQLSGLPPWFWMVGVGSLVFSAAVWITWHRLNEDKNGNGIPDRKEPRP